MTRFYSETEIKKQNMKLNEDLLSHPEKFKEELKQAINAENHRTNVDTAKKSAVSQYMDYDGFHQMVLGADLKGMKLDDVVNIKPEKGILNPLVEGRNLNQPNDIFFKNFIPTNEPSSAQKAKVIPIENEELTLLKFKRKWMDFNDTNAKINYLSDNIPTADEFNEMISKTAIDSNLFSEFIYHFCVYVLKNIDDDSNKEKVEFVYQCLEKVIGSKQYEKLKMFIGKKHKGVFGELYSHPKAKEAFPSMEYISNKLI